MLRKGAVQMERRQFAPHLILDDVQRFSLQLIVDWQ
jgi:hypothetical protein